MYFAQPSPPTATEGLGLTHLVHTPPPVVKSIDPKEREKFLASVAMDAASAPNALEFRKAVALKLSQRNYAATLRRDLMRQAMASYEKSPPQRTTEPRYGTEPLHKAMPRGGAYHARITKPDGKHVYVYTEAEYRQRPDAHVSGGEARSTYLHHHVARVLQKAGEDGCPIEHFAELVTKHGSKAVARALRAHNVHFDGTHVHRKKKPST